MQWASSSSMESPQAQEQQRALIEHIISTTSLLDPAVLDSDQVHAPQWTSDGAFSPEDSLRAPHFTPSADQFAEYIRPGSFAGASVSDGSANEGSRQMVDGHVRAGSEHTQSSSGLDMPPRLTHNTSEISVTGSHYTSGQSSISSFARRVARHGPDLRLINSSRTGMAQRFGGQRRKSMASVPSLKKVKTYDEPDVEIFDLPSTEIPEVSPSESKPPNRGPSWFRGLRRQRSEPDRSRDSSTGSPPTSPNMSMHHIHVHSKSENLMGGSTAFTDDSHSDYSRSVGDDSKKSAESPGRCPSTESSQTRIRPRFPRWKSHSSHLLKQGKPATPSPSSTPARSPPQTPLASPNDSHKQLSLEPPKRSPKRSIKRWLWRGPMTSSDAQSIADVISSSELAAVNPGLAKEHDIQIFTEIGPTGTATEAATQQALSPPPLPTTKRHTRFGSKHHDSSERQTPVLPPLSISPSELSEAALFSPNRHDDRREGSSYFALEESLSTPDRSKPYSPDFIGTKLGGISPLPSPPPLQVPVPRRPQSPQSPSTPKTLTRPECDEYFQTKMFSSRQATARSRSMPMEFVPPGLTRVNTPPRLSASRAAQGQTSGFFFSGPSLDDNEDGEKLQSHARTHHGTSSGFWDSDAVLMSVNVDEDEWNEPQSLAPLQTPDPERDWFRVRMDQMLASEESTKTEGIVDIAAGGDGGPAFVWHVPEHLPGSPLCPLSPKHKSGGKGICVYHGRRKTQRSLVKID